MEKMVNPEFWRNRNVFVTGATGLIGSWLVKYLVDMNANVVALIRDWVPKSKLLADGLLDRVTVVRGELEDLSTLERALGEYEIDTVFHLGAQTIVGIANANPISTFESNIRGTWNVLEACRRSRRVERAVCASSDKAYGDQEVLPYSEATPLQGRHPYDVSKSCSDLICRTYFETYRLPVTVTRCGNFFGGGDLNFNRIVPGTIRAILHKQEPVIRSDGNYVRDYIYCEDAVIAYLMLAEKTTEPNVTGDAFNFSNEAQLTVLQLVEKISALMGSDARPRILNEANGEIRRQFLSAEKARRVLGWAPSFEIDQALRLTINWYRQFFENRDVSRAGRN